MTARAGRGLPTGWRGGLPTGGQVESLCAVCGAQGTWAFSSEHPAGRNRVPGREDRWPGWPRNCLCAKCLCAFSGPYLPFLPTFLVPESWVTQTLQDSSMGQLSFCILCIWIISPSWIHPKRSKKWQVMSPTMALVPTRPFTFSQCLRSQLLLVLFVLGLLTGTVNVSTL